jgi:hypothetical protein
MYVSPKRGHALACLALAAALFAPVARADVGACIASSEQALSLRKQGKLHEALKQLALCADPGCPAEVSAECTQRIAALDAAMPTLILAATDGAGNDLFDVKVSMDGEPLTPKLDGRPLSIDPGEHTFHFEASGQPPLDKQLVVREGEKDRREAVVIGPVPHLAPPAPQPSSPGWWTAHRTLAVIGAGLGVVGVGVGAAFGGYAISAQNRQKSDCGPSACPNFAQAQQDYTTAGQNATASTVAFVAGGAFLAAAAVLWFTQPASSPSAAVATGAVTGPGWRIVPGVGDRAGGLLVGGAF